MLLLPTIIGAGNGLFAGDPASIIKCQASGAIYNSAVKAYKVTYNATVVGIVIDRFVPPTPRPSYLVAFGPPTAARLSPGLLRTS